MSDASDKPCTAQAIQLLNETKEYRLLATCAMRQVLEDPDLSDAAIRGWMTLYCYSARNVGISMVVSTRRLGQILSRSESSIRRILRELQSRGYLEIRERRGRDGGQGANELRPRLPKHQINRLMDETPDRSQASARAQMSDASDIRQKPGEGGVKRFGGLDSRGPGPSGSPMRVESRDSQAEIDDQVRVGQESTSESDSGLSQSSSQQVSLKSLLRVALKHKDAAESVSERYEKMRLEAKNEATRKATMQKRAPARTEEGRAVKSDTHISTRDRLKTNSSVPIEFLMTRAERQLSALGFGQTQCRELVGEIHFAVRQGVFRDHDLTHGVNICLKLIRTNAWRKPAGYQAAG